ncbi:MAG TPA: NUDIX hydrolase [Acidimicrobiales bacterium]|nr:NUDIX hydrolase [Acidimicrobiales bacterium]
MADRGGDGARTEPEFRVVGEEPIFDGYLIRLTRAEVVGPDGHHFEREIVRHPGAVAVIAVDDDDRVWLVRQFRTAIGTTVLEAPAGTRDVDGEPPEETARRELAEEAGLEADRLELLIGAYNSPGYCDQRTWIYLATGLSPTATGRTGVEEHWMTIERVALSDLEALVADGSLADADTVLGMSLARDALARRAAAG